MLLIYQLKKAAAALVATLLLFGGIARAQEFREAPHRSFFIGIELGAALDLGSDARSPADYWDRHPEAYSLAAVSFGVYGGYRFNEIVGVEAAWHVHTHGTPDGWRDESTGIRYDIDFGGATYRMGHLALRLALPSTTRFTPMITIGPVLGAFSYGRASPGGLENNTTLTFGGLIAPGVEFELVRGVVSVLELAYLPLYRFGMDDQLWLWLDCNHNASLDDDYTTVGEYCPDESDQVIDRKDFTKGELVHLLWINLGIQFEWIFR